MSSVGLVWFISIFLFELKWKGGERGNQFRRVKKKRAEKCVTSGSQSSPHSSATHLLCGPLKITHPLRAFVLASAERGNEITPEVSAAFRLRHRAGAPSVATRERQGE